MSSRLTLSGLLALTASLAACSSDPGTEASSVSTGAGPGSGSSAQASSSGAGGGADSDAGKGGEGGGGGASPTVPDGPAERVACTGTFGNALTATHGRMDGYLVAIVPPGGPHKCNSDAGHVHLQVKINGAIYDVAVNTDVLYAELDAPLPDGPWAEGWHPGDKLDYPTSLGLHATTFTTTTPTALVQKVTSALAAANHISIFATGYGPDGGHDVHRKGNSEDGAIVIDPLSPKAHILAFRFVSYSF